MRSARLLLFLVLSSPAFVYGQADPAPPIDVLEAADPTSTKTRVTLDFESYIFYQPAQFYAVRVGYLYGLQNDRHQFGISVPFVHNVFGEDLQGYENTTGVGDVRMWYMASLPTGNPVGISRVAPYFEITAPTGEYLLGRGAGTWLYKPGVIFGWTIDPQISFYPEVRFLFSGDDANMQGGSDVPDPETPEKDGKLQTLVVQFPAVVLVESFRGWFGASAQYQQSFSTDEYFIYFRLDFGTMLAEKTAASLHISKFIAGQQRVNLAVQARFQFFFR